MKDFILKRATRPEEVSAAETVRQKFLAGGTTLVDLMKLHVETPEVVMDINHLPWKEIKEINDGWSVGALVTNSELAYHKDIRKNYKVLSDAILSGASAQLRNKATTGGNLLQRTRCVYFRDPSKACNKRDPGSGCAAIDGFNRNLAILGTSSSCIATNPSDMNVALAALRAKIILFDGSRERVVEMGDFHKLPGDTPHIETILEKNELIRGVILPKLSADTKSSYLKLRDRASYEFAIASIGIVLNMDGKRIRNVNLAMGGIGTKPWRVESAEKILEGAIPSKEVFAKAADEFLKGSKTYSQNSFKLETARRCFVTGLTKLTSGEV
jgi:xanthine dehydrogenase YagS FAD-binding subunit